jgi:hypothetical protein
MKHDQYRELLHLFLFHELDEEERQVLDEHLKTCSACSEELVELQKLDSILQKGARLEVTDELLAEARRELRVALRLVQARRSRWSEWVERFGFVSAPAFRVALVGVATLVIGISVGYLAFAPSAVSGVAGMIPAVKTSAVERSDTRVSAFRFVQQASETGEVEFVFDLVTPVRMRGNVSDNAIQRVLAQALLSEENPGARLRTVSTLASQLEPMGKPDPEIKGALLQTVKSDGNVGVRKQALRALQKFPIDKEIKDALLYVLRTETNPAMRIEVINHLEKPMLSRELAGQDILDVLKERMQNDKNNYIRLRAQNVYEEVKQQ